MSYERPRRSLRARIRRIATVVGITVLVLAVGVAGFALGRATAPTTAPTAVPAAETGAPTRPAPIDPAIDAGGYADRIGALAAHGGGPDVPYRRDEFGQRWTDVDRNGCDTRNDILGRDLAAPVFKDGTRDCKVLTGMLTDPYDGTIVNFVSGQDTSALVQIDHVIALAWAWEHGAWAWPLERRIEFANDPDNLLATSEAMNQAKKASGPGSWLPPTLDGRCTYLERFVTVAERYALSIDDDDRKAALTVAAECD